MKIMNLYLYAVARKFAFIAINKAEEKGDTETARALRRDIMTDGTEGGAGMQLVYAGYIALLQAEASAPIPEGIGFTEWITYKYTVRTYGRRIITEGAKAEPKDTETTARKQAFSAIWRALRETAGTRYSLDRYCYIEDLGTDTEGTEEALYKRLPAYHTAIDGMRVDEGILFDTETLLDSLKMTKAQKIVVRYRLQGYGKKAIASAQGVTPHAIAKRLQGIQQKALAIMQADKPEPQAKALAAYAEACLRMVDTTPEPQADSHILAYYEEARKARAKAEEARTASTDTITTPEEAEAFRKACKALAVKRNRKNVWTL